MAKRSNSTTEDNPFSVDFVPSFTTDIKITLSGYPGPRCCIGCGTRNTKPHAKYCFLSRFGYHPDKNDLGQIDADYRDFYAENRDLYG